MLDHPPLRQRALALLKPEIVEVAWCQPFARRSCFVTDGFLSLLGFRNHSLPRKELVGTYHSNRWLSTLSASRCAGRLDFDGSAPGHSTMPACLVARELCFVASCHAVLRLCNTFLFGDRMMSETAAWIVDSEGFLGSCSRVCGSGFRPDVVKVLRRIQEFRPERSNLWVKWIAPVRPPETAASAERSNPFFRCLRSSGIRLDLVEGKPVSRITGQLEANACDFSVIKAIRIAQKKADTIVLAANDGHFAHALDEAHFEYGCRIEVVCDRRGLSRLIKADQFHYLDDILPTQDFAYRPSNKWPEARAEQVPVGQC